MKKEKIILENEAIEILAGLLTGFLELIKNDIIHRDLKPEKIIFHDST
jgi:serine/threonine protein kinase